MDDVGSEEGSRSSTESRSEQFVRTKAANISSIEDPLDMNLDTVDKNNASGSHKSRGGGS